MILSPGLHVALCAVWDTKANSSSEKTNIYYVTSVVAYIFGLIFTAVALNLTETGQPALLYIVPPLLLTTAVVGCARGELGCFMRGKFSSGVDGDREVDVQSEESNHLLDQSGSTDPLT